MKDIKYRERIYKGQMFVVARMYGAYNFNPLVSVG